MASVNERLLQCRKALFFPTIHDFQNGQMHFIRWTGNSRLQTNKYNIPEVLPNHPALRARALDLILVPLVGFDCAGNRLGMGGGFYDRYLASYRPQIKPFALGVAFDIQREPQIKVEPWDYPLDAILTETGIQRFPR